VARTGAEELFGVTPWQFAPVEDGFEDHAGFWRQFTRADFFLGPDQDAIPQALRLDKPFHEIHLVEAGFEEEFCEVCERFLA
jgi:hypothetical protein